MDVLRIGYGPSLPSIADQLKELGFQSDDAYVLEKKRHAINLLRLHDILPSSQADKCLVRLHKQVKKSIKPTA